MREQPQRIIHTKVGDERAVAKFILFPKTLPIGRNSEIEQTRWLETCTTVQRYKFTDFMDSSFLDYDWIDIFWKD
jgi:hypothetical protein